MSIKLVRLTTREDILADVTENEAGDYIILTNPIRVVVMPPDPKTQFDPKRPANIGFAPWTEFSDDKSISIDKFHVLAIMTPIKQFVDQYNSLFSKIVTPQTGLILPGS